MNGQLRPEIEIESDWPETQLPKTAGFSGTLELGNLAPNSNWALGTLFMDELMIWENVLTCDDILRLYQSYS